MSPVEFSPITSPRIVAIPIAFNEEQKIGSVLDRFAEVQGVDIAVLDDGSTDGTPHVICEKGAMLSNIPSVRAPVQLFVRHTVGHGIAVTTSA